MKKGMIKISNVIYEEEIESEYFKNNNKKNTPDKLTEDDKFKFTENIKSSNSQTNEDLNKKPKYHTMRNDVLLKYFPFNTNNEKINHINEKDYYINNNINEKIISIKYITAQNYFYNLDYSKEKKLIKKEEYTQQKSFIKKCLCCFSKNELKQRLHQEREIIFCISKLIYDDNIKENFQILSTIYKFLTNKNICPKIGEHWEKIGFQSINPKDDLDKVGMLGPLQILFLIEKYSNFTFNFYQYLFINKCEWLFCSILFNLTFTILNILKKGKINSSCNKRENVFPVINDLFCGMNYKLFNLIKNNNKNNDALTAEFISNNVDKVIKLTLEVPNTFLNQEIQDLEKYEKKLKQ